MRIARHALGAATIALTALLALSCNNAYGIFSNIQDEKEQSGSFQKTPVYSAFKLNGSYFAATATLRRRNIAAGSSWSKVSIGSDNYFLRSAVLVGPTAYALVGLESSDAALYSSPDGDSWTKITLPSSSVVSHGSVPYAFDVLYSTTDNQLFAVGHAFVESSGSDTGTNYYDLWHYNGASFDPVLGFTNLTDETIRGVVYDGADYWFAAEEHLSYDNSVTNAAGTPVSVPSDRTIWDISYAGGNIYISTKEGDLYQGAFADVEDVTSVPLTQVIQVPGPSGDILLVGTDTDDVNDSADGYYEGTFHSLDHGNDEAIVADTSSIFNTTVSGLPVHSFLWDSATNNLFACVSPGTSSKSLYGLYLSTWNGGEWSGWEAE